MEDKGQVQQYTTRMDRKSMVNRPHKSLSVIREDNYQKTIEEYENIDHLLKNLDYMPT